MMLSYAMLALLTTCFSSLQVDQGYKVLKSWDFNANEDWSYGNEIINPEDQQKYIRVHKFRQ